MHFLESWTELSPFDLIRLLGPPALLTAVAFLPGMRVVRLAALGVALTIPFLRELGASPLLTAAWSALWLVVAWAAGVPEDQARRPRPRAAGGSRRAPWGCCSGWCCWCS